MKNLARRMVVVEAIAYLGKFGSATPAGGIPASLLVTDWYVDPKNSTGLASNENDGQAPTRPFLTLSRLTEVLGTEQPDYNNSSFIATVHMLSDTNASDPFVLRPVNGTIIVAGLMTALTSTGAAQTGPTPVATDVFGVITPKTFTPPQRWQAFGTAIASWTPFLADLVHDLTNDTWFFVDADLGGGQARITQPMQNAIAPGFPSASAVPPRPVPIPAGMSVPPRPPILTPAVTAGDSFIVFKLSTVHVSQAGGQYGTAQVIFQNCHMASRLGLAGQSYFERSTIWQQCSFDCIPIALGDLEMKNFNFAGGVPTQATSRTNPVFMNCRLGFGFDVQDPFVFAGSLNGGFYAFRQSSEVPVVQSGTYVNGAFTAFAGFGSLALGDVGFFNTTIFPGVLSILTIGMGTFINSGAQALYRIGLSEFDNDSTPGKIWGTVAITVMPGGWISSFNGVTLDMLTTGSVKVAGFTSASSFDPATGIFSPQVGAGSVTLGAMPAAAVAIDATPNQTVTAPNQNCGIMKQPTFH